MRKRFGWRMCTLPLVSPQRMSNTMNNMSPLVRKNNR